MRETRFGHGASGRTTMGSLPDLGRSIELVRAFQAGEGEALDELFRRYHERLRRIVRVKMGAGLRRLLDEEDLMQEVFLVAARGLADFEPRSHASILHWLAKIAEHKVQESVAFHHRQRRDARREVPLDPATSSSSAAPAEPAAPDPSPSQLSIRAELEELVDALVERLEPPAYREVVLQRDYFGADWEEVRAALDRPTVEAAQELYRRAHARLTEMVRRRVKLEG